MKILTIVNSVNRDGSALSLLNTLVGLKQCDYSILALVPGTGFFTETLDHYNIEYKIVKAPFWVFPPLNNFKDIIRYLPRLIKTLIYEQLSLRKVKHLTKSWKPDIIHTNVSVIDVGYKIARKYKIPHVWHIREYGKLDFDLNYLSGKKLHLRYLQDSYCISITKDLKKYYKLGDKCKVIYNGIVDGNSNIEATVKENKILFVGRLTKKKGAENVIRAFVKFASKNNDFILELIGGVEPKYEKYLKGLIPKGIKDRITFSGPINNVYPKMQTAKAIVVASENEGFGRITAEAMINKCLVIGKNTGGTKEQFDNGFDYCNEEIGIRYLSQSDLTNALKQFANLDETSYEKIILNAYNTVKKYYNEDQNIRQVYSILKDIKNRKF